MIYANKKIEKALNEMGFEEFTPIQTDTIPMIQQGKDIIGHSQTGTGKTAAFAIPILEHLDYDNTHIQAIVLCPTRELAVQVKSEIDKIGKYLPQLKTVAIYGGESIQKQIISLKKKPQIIVGTPGRTIDHINRKLVKLGNIKYLVLDEADEMLKMGFKEDIETILEASNEDRQTVLFSATMPKTIVGISKKYMKDPQLISVVTGEEPNKDITQYYYTVHEKNKVEAVARLLHVYNPKLTLIFCNTKRKVDDVSRELTKKGYNVNKIHGDLQQTTRLQVLDSFHAGVLDMLVATDVAARGLDIKNVEAVINFDVPEKAEYYVHRIGRTGRIGNKGYSFTLVSRREMGRIKDIERYTKISIKKRNVPTPEKVIAVRQQTQITEIEDIIENINTNPYYETSYKLLATNDPIHVVSALLFKLEKKDSSETVLGDINDNYSKSNNRDSSGGRGSRNRGNRNQSDSSSSEEGTTRYHLNIGSLSGVTPKVLADFVTRKTRLRNSQVSDIAIRQNFCFFSTDSTKETQIMKSLSNATLNGKKISVQLASVKK